MEVMLTWVIYNKFQEFFHCASDPCYVLNITDAIVKVHTSLPFIVFMATSVSTTPTYQPFPVYRCVQLALNIGMKLIHAVKIQIFSF